ncbi:MAG: isochorismate synthase [Chloroflexi bacterium]|nr:isochorismate synthase [Chloroflexota bacterium]
MESTSIHDAPINQRYGRLLSCSLSCDGIAFDRFLEAAEGQARFFWENCDEQMAFAGVGAAIELMAWGPERFAKIMAYARELFDGAFVEAEDNPLTTPRLFGGFSFRHDFMLDKTWSIYTPAFFALPHYQLARAGSAAWLTINTQIPYNEAPETLIPDLRTALEQKIAQLKASEPLKDAADINALQSIDYPMSYPVWEAMIEEATQGIRAGALRKVVLARAAELRFHERVKLLQILRHLAAQYANCYRFLFEPRPRYAFYGASPELLASVQGRQLETMALAGSAARGDTAETDRCLGDALLANDKERHEHDIVVEKMCQGLSPLTESLEVQPARLLKLSNIQHINTPIQGRLKRASGILPLIETLHPTPALGGDPRPDALRLIRELEPIPRGWYGAPIGWIDAHGNGQFAVAIRSAVAQESRAWVYAGAGIVADSVPRREWEETELKFRPMLEAHGILQQ